LRGELLALRGYVEHIDGLLAFRVDQRDFDVASQANARADGRSSRSSSEYHFDLRLWINRSRITRRIYKRYAGLGVGVRGPDRVATTIASGRPSDRFAIKEMVQKPSQSKRRCTARGRERSRVLVSPL